MRKIFLLLSLCFLSVQLFADTTFSFLDSEKKLTGTTRWNGSNGWINTTTKAGLHRYYGIGLGTAIEGSREAMGMETTFEEPQAIFMVTVQAYASTKAAVSAKEIALTFTATRTDETVETFQYLFNFDTISTIDAPAPVDIIFTLPSGNAIQHLSLTNSSKGDFYVEIGTITLHRTVPPVEADLFVDPTLLAGTTAYASIQSISGGTGNYNEDYTMQWILDGDEANAQTTAFYYSAYAFETPAEEGEHTVTFRMIAPDSTVYNFTKPFNVSLRTNPSNIQATNITRTGFTLTWENTSPVAPESYTIQLSAPSTTLEQNIPTQWTSDGQGNQVCAIPFPINNPSQCTFQLAQLAYKIAPNKTLQFSTDNITWNNILLGTIFVPSNKLSTLEDTLYLRILNCDTFQSHIPLKLIYKATNQIWKQEIIADGSSPSYTFEDLPSGMTFNVLLTSNYANDTRHSSTTTVTLKQPDPLSDIQTWGSYIYITWPENSDIAYGQYTYLAETLRDKQGLFLTRTFHNTGAKASKGLVLSNTSDADIDLGQYAILYTRKTGTTARWTMSNLIIPAKSERCFAYPNDANFPLPEGTLFIKETALNIADGGWLTLIKADDTVVGIPLPIKTKNVTSLATDLVSYDHTTYTADPTLTTLSNPWTAPKETHTVELSSHPLRRDDEISYNLTSLLSLAPEASTIKIRAVTRENDAISTPIVETLWTAPKALGYLLRLY